MKPWFWLLILASFPLSAGAWEAGFLGPGTVVSRGGWTLSVRADRYDGPVPLPRGGEPAPDALTVGGPVTASLLDYPVVLLKSPRGQVWEYSTLTGDGEVAGLEWLRLEPDWDGDGFPEVAGRFHQGYRVGQGIRPSGIVSILDKLLLPGPSGWKGEVELGGVVGDEGGGEIRGLSAVLTPGTLPVPTDWSWSESEGPEPGTRHIRFSVAPLLWHEAALSDLRRSTATAVVTSSEAGSEADPGWPRVTVNDDRVNLRAAGGTSFPSLGLLARGTVLLVQGMDSEPGVSGNLRSPWLKVAPVSGPLAGKTGWVFAHFCTPAF